MKLDKFRAHMGDITDPEAPNTYTTSPTTVSITRQGEHDAPQIKQAHASQWKGLRVRGNIEQYDQASRYGYSRRQMRCLRGISGHIPSVDWLKLYFVDEGFRARLVDLVKVTLVAVRGISREKLGRAYKSG